MLIDSWGRQITYLRISVTDRCNLRCVYCMPPEGIQLQAHADILRYEEIAEVVRAAAQEGVREVRLTGGEPLTRPNLPALVGMLSSIPGIKDISLTTNALLLERFAIPLAEAGLKRVNISLDTLRPERYAAMTRRGRLEDVLAGIAAAERAGLTPIKINVVVVRGLNDDEVPELARRAVEDGWNVRFIEVMPLGAGPRWEDDGYVPSAELRRRIEADLGPLQAVDGDGGGPARYYRLPGATGTIGFISPLSEHFCARCDRLRLTADGQLLPCLMSEEGIDMRPALRSGASDEELRGRVEQAIHAKPAGHEMGKKRRGAGAAPMSRIGG
jgi:cyclic pyranopterin phosphate synthase